VGRRGGAYLNGFLRGGQEGPSRGRRLGKLVSYRRSVRRHMPWCGFLHSLGFPLFRLRGVGLGLSATASTPSSAASPIGGSVRARFKQNHLTRRGTVGCISSCVRTRECEREGGIIYRFVERYVIGIVLSITYSSGDDP